MRILRCELLEISIVAIPADYGALVTERAFSMSKPTIGALRAALSEIGDAHDDIHEGLTTNRPQEARRALSRAGRSLDRAVNIGQRLDQLNTSKTQNSGGMGFGTSDGHGPASLEAVDKPRSFTFAARQGQLAALAPRNPFSTGLESAFSLCGISNLRGRRRISPPPPAPARSGASFPAASARNICDSWPACNNSLWRGGLVKNPAPPASRRPPPWVRASSPRRGRRPSKQNR